MTLTFVGVDIAKHTFDVAIEHQNRILHRTFQNQPQGFQDCLSWLLTFTSTPWLCMEATGIYSEPFATFLVEKGYPVTVENPLKIKRFIQSQLTRTKNDKLDAKLILQYAKTFPLNPYLPKTKLQNRLSEGYNLLEIQKHQLAQLKNLKEATNDPQVLESLEQTFQALSKSTKELEKRLLQWITAHPETNTNYRRLRSIPGIGFVTALAFLAKAKPIQLYDKAKSFAASLGLTPKEHQSGKMKGKSSLSKIGHPILRKALYMAALSAKRHNPPLHAFAHRLLQHGKKPKAVLCAVMRKLAHLIFALMKHQTTFDPHYQHQTKGPIPG